MKEQTPAIAARKVVLHSCVVPLANHPQIQLSFSLPDRALHMRTETFGRAAKNKGPRHRAFAGTAKIRGGGFTLDSFHGASPIGLHS